MTNFGDIRTHLVSVNCSVNDTSLANCVDLDDYDFFYNYYDFYDGYHYYNPDIGLGLGCTTHAGLICHGEQI